MDKLLSWIRSFGNAGAVANADELRAQHRREEWIMRGLTARITRTVEEVKTAAA
jgi:hypothetical protein